eukprot:CAMPEP_0181430882 /NCGR_PEP_ID=MMETSP1110-20121109/17954_1 /TAXON_ID=174948 /ORGANISM="Symbiodinium sp., Strain CCMP421" /LENGTH=386 /DNA_ID=CAMNT_0023554215 /DNA_START=62 /DNA_END=1219 /DNA_ORIENTATION=-
MDMTIDDHRHLCIWTLGGADMWVTVPAAATIRCVKQQLQARHLGKAFGVTLALIHEGKVLEDDLALHSICFRPLQLVSCPARIVLAHVRNKMVLWDPSSSCQMEVATALPAVTAMAADVQGLRIIMGFSNGHLAVLDLAKGMHHITRCKWTQKQPIFSLHAFWKSDKAVVACGTKSAWYEISDRNRLHCLRTTRHPGCVISAALGGEGKDLLAVMLCQDSGIVLCDQQRQSLQHAPRATALDIDWTERKLVAGTSTGELVMWSFVSGRLVKVHDLAQAPQLHVRAVAANWSKDRAIAAGRDGYLCVWHLTSRCLLSCIRGHQDLIWKIHLHDSSVVSCSFDGTMKLWTFQDDFRVLKLDACLKGRFTCSTIVPPGEAAELAKSCAW